MSDEMAVPEIVKGCCDGRDFQNVKGDDSEVFEADFKSLEGKKPIRIKESDIDGFAGRGTECQRPYAQPSAEVFNVDNAPKIPKLQKRVNTTPVQTDEIWVSGNTCKKVCKRKNKEDGVLCGYSSSVVDNDRMKQNWIENGIFFNGQLYKLVPVSNDGEARDIRKLGQAPKLQIKPVQAISASDECYNYGQPLDLTVKNGPSLSVSSPLDLSLKKEPLGEPTMDATKSETIEPAQILDGRLSAHESDMDDWDSIIGDCGNPVTLMDTGQCERANSSCSVEFSNLSLRGVENSQKHNRDKKQMIIHTEDIKAFLLNAQANKQPLLQAASQNPAVGALIALLYADPHKLTFDGKGAHENNVLQVIESDEPDVPKILSSMPESQTAIHASAQAIGSMGGAVSSPEAAVVRPIARRARATHAMAAIGGLMQQVIAPIPATVSQVNASSVNGASAPMQPREPPAITAATKASALKNDTSTLPQMPNLQALNQIDENGLLLKNQFETSQLLLKGYYKKKDN